MVDAQSDSARANGAPANTTARCEEHPNVLEQLQNIESRLNDLSSDRQAADSLIAESSAIQIKEALECQTASLQALSDGLRQLQQHITADVVDAIGKLPLATELSETGTGTDIAIPKGDSEKVDTAPAANAPSSQQQAAATSSSEPGLTSWEMIRQAMLDTEEENSEPATVQEVAEPEMPPEPTNQTELEDSSPEPERLEFVVPDPFDCDSIDDESLREAFLEREEILRLMSIRLLHTAQPKPAMTTDQLRELAVTLPDDLRERAEASLAKLDEQLRLTELELSLERARMARQRTQLENTRHRVETNARQLGYKINEDGSLEETAESAERAGRSGRRWLRVLGFGG